VLLQVGARGPAVADLQRRLHRLGFDPGISGSYDEHTTEAVRSFQRRRRLPVDGVCGPETWSALVEADYRLGDRVLSRQVPMLRGDDIAELQERLGALGFDAGRVDGIFGDDTARALREFQRNVGLPVDGVCGPEALAELRRLEHRADRWDVIAEIKEREALRRSPRTLQGHRVVIAHVGDLGPAAAAVCQALSSAGALVAEVAEPDPSRRAAHANAFCAQAYLELQVNHRAGPSTTAYYAGYRFRSAGGQRLAELLEAHLASLGGRPVAQVVGLSLQVLRETKMPAVVAELDPALALADQLGRLAEPVVEALEAWVRESWE
jgi:N-acetylmuramoyl-L-alanine amidase